MGKVFINTIFSCCLIFFVTSIANAQIQRPGITLGGNIIYAKPKGDFNEMYNFGGGGEVFGGVGLGKTFIIATGGYSAFKAKSGTHSGTLTYTPVKIGLKQFILGKTLFVNADIGKATVKYKDFNESRFTRGIGFGAKLIGLEAALYYDGWKNKNASGFSNSLNVKVGWNILL